MVGPVKPVRGHPRYPPIRFALCFAQGLQSIRITLHPLSFFEIISVYAVGIKP